MKKSKIDIQVLSKEEQESRINNLKGKCDSDAQVKKLMLDIPNPDQVVEKSCLVLMNYFDDREICKNCKGFSHCPKGGMKGYKIILKNNYYSNTIEQNYAPCSYYKEIIDVLDNIIYSDLSKMDIYKYSDTAKAVLKTNRSTLKDSFLFTAKKCLIKIKEYKDSDLNVGYLIHSENHNGEAISYLLSYAFARKGNTVAVIDAKSTLNNCSSLIEKIKMEGEKNLNSAKNADVLIITNLGLEYKSKAAADLILSPLFMDRAKRGKITFISSFLDYDEILESYSKDRISRKIFKKIIDKIVEPIEVKDIEYFTD